MGEAASKCCAPSRAACSLSTSGGDRCVAPCSGQSQTANPVAGPDMRSPKSVVVAKTVTDLDSTVRPGQPMPRFPMLPSAERLLVDSSGVAFVSSVMPAEFQATWKLHTWYHAHARTTHEQSFGDVPEISVYDIRSAGSFPRSTTPVVLCTKGCKGRTDLPNQDSFSITLAKKGWWIAVLCDGHGLSGHKVAQRAVQTLPYYLLQSTSFPGDMRRALTEAFELSHLDLLADASEAEYDVRFSGCTATVAMWRGPKLWVAHAGDVRVAMSYMLSQKRVHFETRDHRPEAALERLRIEAWGGEVRTGGGRWSDRGEGFKIPRVYVKGYDVPGLCMARSLGDEAVKGHGVVADPEIAEMDMDVSLKPIIVIASDGIWEVVETETAMQIAKEEAQNNGLRQVLKRLQEEACHRWCRDAHGYCDDITAIVAQLGQECT
eukprot:gnl/TRDRNA2_/TRDRNA2_39659_c0_seq1.p1 gnl/TRDRNA2_/TRDRNA2_39659_c0~~gnl/TRDRNA2_/TRDRNA2_39659_c0_seq1.p1  ORF type:complete len:448 (+),score=58.27 gnl/TRDRNA2_/TRDRNA2_39659_c0_seq1:47-1345(+)